MIKTETCVLKNGVRLVMSQDKTKNSTYMEIVVKFGGLNRKFSCDGKTYEIKPGIAHLLEHSLIESSIYGNMFDYLKDDYVSFNGVTSPLYTSYYIDTVMEPDRHLEELIRMVNIANITDESLLKIKPPIIEEIKRGKDRPYDEFMLGSINQLLVNNEIVNNLGEEEDINKCDSKYLTFIHDIFYQPQNQIIALSGNFDIDEYKKKIESIYDKIEFKKYDLKILDESEEDGISAETLNVVKPDLDEIVNISFKVSLKHLSAKERVLLDFSLDYFLEYNFDDASEAFKKVKDMNLSPYSINKRVVKYFKDYIFISVFLYGNNLEEFKKIVFDVFERKPYNEEMFKLWKKSKIIDLIKREEHCNKMLSPFIDNVLTYNYYDIDKISDIENLTLDDYLKLINSLDFSHFSISTQTKK